MFLRLICSIASVTFASIASVTVASSFSASFEEVQTWSCGGAGSGAQTWAVTSVGGEFIFVSSTRGSVLSIPGASNKTNVPLVVEARAHGSPASSQLWSRTSATSPSLLRSALNGRCAAASVGVPGARVYLQPCNSSDALQQWYDGVDGLLELRGGALGAACLDVGGALNCSAAPLARLPFCNASSEPEIRAEDLAGRLGIDDLRLLLGGWYQSAGVPRLGLARFSIAEALHGLGAGCGAAFSNASYTTSGCATSFPHATLLAATFNRSLWRAVGDVISTEARATRGGLLLWTPDVNLVRAATWGRAQEVPSECPLLTSEYAAAFVQGLQAEAPGRPVRAVATCKHFAAYDFEGNADPSAPFPSNLTRHTFDARVSRKDLAEFYLPPFYACVARGGALSVMTSINAVNGVPGVANSNFTVALLRDAWHARGFATSDCGTVSDLVHTHNFSATPEEAVGAAIAGGTDYNCGNAQAAGVAGEGFFNLYLASALASGRVQLSALRAAAARLLSVVIRLGFLDPPASNPYADWGPERVDTPAARALALAGAVQGIVLLRNLNSTLPLKLGALHSLAVLGPHGNMTSAMQSSYAGSNELVHRFTPLLRLQARAEPLGVRVNFVAGVPSADSNDTSGVAAAAAAAASADATVLFLGLDQVLEREGLDRARLTLPPAQAALLEAVSAASSSAQLVVVLVGGGAIAEAAPAAQALVASFYPGECGGEALAQLLLGEAPFSGRLPVTVYTADYALRRAPTDMQLAPHGTTPGATHWYAAKNDTLFAFGAGLSTAPLSIALTSAAEVTIDARAWALGTAHAPTWTVDVTSGAMAGSAAAVVLSFFELGRGHNEPAAKLFDFARTDDIAPGARVLLNLSLPAAVAALVDSNGTRTLTPGRFRVRLGGDAAGDAAGLGAAPIFGWVNITGEPVVIDGLPW